MDPSAPNTVFRWEAASGLGETQHPNSLTAQQPSSIFLLIPPWFGLLILGHALIADLYFLTSRTWLL